MELTIRIGDQAIPIPDLNDEEFGGKRRKAETYKEAAHHETAEEAPIHGPASCSGRRKKCSKYLGLMCVLGRDLDIYDLVRSGKHHPQLLQT